MDTQITSTNEDNTQVPVPTGELPRSLAIASAGIKTGRDFSNMMSALMSDLIEGKITPGVGNATVNAGGKLLRMVELQMKYGQNGSGSGEKNILLAG